MINKMRRRFIAAAMLAVILVTGILGLSINIVNYAYVNDGLCHMLELIYENDGALPNFGRKFQDKPNYPRLEFTPETPFATRYFVLNYNEDGTLINTDTRHIAAVTDENIKNYLNIALSSGGGFGYYDGYKFLVRQTNSGNHTAIFLDCRRELGDIKNYVLITLTMVGVGNALIFILVILFSKRAVAPAIKNIEKQKRFITDASHELKTPLTVINTSLKVLELENGQNKWTDKIQHQSDKLGELIENLITLARYDEQNAITSITRFSLDKAVSEAAEPFTDTAQAKGQRITINAPSPVNYTGDEYAVRRLVSILLDNAVKYAEPDTNIRLNIVKTKTGVEISVTNACKELSDEETERLFDRFYRVDDSRSQKTGGFGIGLSIARGIAQAHKGKISGKYHDGTLTVTAQLRDM